MTLVFVLYTAKIQPPQHADEHNEANSFIKLHLNSNKSIDIMRTPVSAEAVRVEMRTLKPNHASF